jgi:hypothetical protein
LNPAGFPPDFIGDVFMSFDERQIFLKREYAEAIRYMDNAKEFLQKAKKESSFYTDKKPASFLHAAYNVLHLDGYYDGITNVKAIDAGFDAAYEIIEKIKPIKDIK